jgi:proteasome alpha subunit
MTEEPYRWLEAVGNRREYVREQLKDGSPVFAVVLDGGVLLAGVGGGHSKVFELFDRHALAGLGHPADIEKIRQAAIDAAHTEAFTRAPEDVSLRRLVGFGISPQLKTGFEQIYNAPFLVELILAELANGEDKDLLVRLHHDGAFQLTHSGAVVAAADAEAEAKAAEWLNQCIQPGMERSKAADFLLQAWWCIVAGKSFDNELPQEKDRREGWKKAVSGKTVEMAWLSRDTKRQARYEPLTLEQLGI